MKKISLIIIFLSFVQLGFTQIPKYEIGFQAALWNATHNLNGGGIGSGFYFKEFSSVDFSNYPFNYFDVGESSRRVKYDNFHTMPMLRVFARRNFDNFYLSSGINFTREDVSFRMPYNYPNAFLESQVIGVSTSNFEVPLYVGYRLGFFEYIRFYAGIIPTFSFRSAYNDDPYVRLRNIEPQTSEDLKNALLEFQQGLIDSYRPFFFSGSAGIGFDYKFISLDLQIDRSLSMSRSDGVSINNAEIRLDERKTRRMLWIGFKIPLN